MTDGKHVGPLDIEAVFVAGLTKNYRLAGARKGWPDYKARYYETYLPGSSKATLTHGDVQHRNIMVVESGKNAQGDRAFDVVPVDWKSAAWCPGFWEAFCAISSPLFVSVVWEDGWCWRIHEFLEAWPAEVWLDK